MEEAVQSRTPVLLGVSSCALTASLLNSLYTDVNEDAEASWARESASQPLRRFLVPLLSRDTASSCDLRA